MLESMALFSKGLLGNTFHIPIWVIIACYTMISLGTMFGGWRIVKTMGTKITKLQPIGGFSAETAAACSIIGAIVGVGATKRLSAVRWGVAGNIIWTWILTISVSAFIYLTVNYFVR
jgi:PiT family inorganic phosphate transporter